PPPSPTLFPYTTLFRSSTLSLPNRSRGSVSVQSRPAGARVFMNNRLIGSTPLAIPDLPAGPAAVRIEMDGYQTWATTVHVNAGRSEEHTSELQSRGHLV